MTITVRQEHIDAARDGPTYCWKCPVWQAAEEAGIKGIRNVTPFSIKITGPPGAAIGLPFKASGWILRFDAGKAVEPFNFEVEA